MSRVHYLARCLHVDINSDFRCKQENFTTRIV